MYGKILRATNYIKIALFILMLGAFVQSAVGQKININNGIVTVQKFFTTQIYLNNILGITERISTRDGSPFYLIETTKGCYEIDDDLFLLKEGKQIIDEIGLVKISIDEENIGNVYLLPEIANEFQFSLRLEDINYNFGRPNRARSLENTFFNIYISLMITLISLFIMIPFGYCFFYPEHFHDIFSSIWGLQKKSISLKSAKILSALLFITGFSLLAFCCGISIIL